MDLRERRMFILHRVESGEVSLEQGNRMLAELTELALENGSNPMAAAGVLLLGSLNPVSDASQSQLDVFEHIELVETEQKARRLTGWRGLWVLPFLLGLFLTLVSTNGMYLGLVSAGPGWGFWLSFFPLGLGIGVMWAGWEMRQARWLHLRIRQRHGRRPAVIAISLPLPIGLTRWAVQRYGKFAPQVNGQDVGDFLNEFDHMIATDGLFHVFVKDEDGEQVEIWIEGPAKK